MNSALVPVHRRRLQDHAVAVRRSVKPGMDGYLYCDGCGRNAVSIGDVAEAAGTTTATVRKWLNRGVVRDDIARRIRSVLLRTEE